MEHNAPIIGKRKNFFGKGVDFAPKRDYNIANVPRFGTQGERIKQESGSESRAEAALSRGSRQAVTVRTNGNLSPAHYRKEHEMRVKLQKLRQANGYTQQTFSDTIGISRNHYSQIETGDKNPSLKLALRIKKALNYQQDDIFDNIALGRR